MRLSDLPPGKLRDQALAKLGETPKPKRARRPATPGLAMICRTCGARIERATPAAIDRHGCTGRYSCDLEAR